MGPNLFKVATRERREDVDSIRRYSKLDYFPLGSKIVRVQTHAGETELSQRSIVLIVRRANQHVDIARKAGSAMESLGVPANDDVLNFVRV